MANIAMLWGKFSLLKMDKYQTDYPAIVSHRYQHKSLERKRCYKSKSGLNRHDEMLDGISPWLTNIIILLTAPALKGIGVRTPVIMTLAQ